MVAGDVAVFTSFFRDNAVPGRTTEYQGFRVSEPRFIAEESGQLWHDDDDQIEAFHMRTSASGFIAAVEFVNPYSRNAGTWDYGIAFRDATGPNDFHAVVVDNGGGWQYFVRDGSATPTHRDSGRAVLNLQEGGTNRLWLLVVGDTALLYVNGALAAELDISLGADKGDIWVGTGFFAGNERAGSVTEYRDFQVWSLD